MNNASLELGGDNWAAKDGNLLGYAVGDSSGKYVPNEFTFTRGSNLSATRVNADGYIEKGYENTLLGSNDWAQSDSQYEITGGEVGYDGTNDAWLVNKLAAAYFGKGGVSISSVATISIYAKAGSLDKLLVFFAGESARFDLTNVTAVKSGGGTIGQSIELVSGTTDWYRCSLAINVTSSGNLLIKPLNSSNQDVTGTMYIQDAMINQGLVAYPYIETTTASVEAIILENEPRIDYSSGTASLLLEPQRTNNVTSSEYFQSGWNNLGSRVSFGNNTTDTLSPEGKYNATKLIKNLSGNPTLRINAITAGNAYVFTCWAKAGTSNLLELDISDAAATTFTLTNEWQRFEVKTSSAANNFVDISLKSSSNIGEYVYVWGAQVEEGAYPTSYIPTYGVSQTRGDDFFDSSADFTNFFGNDQGTIYIETNERLFKDETSNEEFIGFRDDTKYWRIIGANNVIFTQSVNWGSTILHYPSATNPTKYLFKWDGSNVSFYIDGSLVGTAAQTATFNPNQFGRGGNGVSMNSEELLNQFTLFPTALTDSECIELTTI